MLFFFILIFTSNFYFLKKSSLRQYQFQKHQFRINQDFNYYTSLPESRSIGKDLRIYQLGDMIESKIADFFKQSEKTTKDFALDNARILSRNDAFSSFFIGCMYVLVFYLAKIGMLGVGYVAQCVGLLQQINQAIIQLVLSYVSIVQKSKYIDVYWTYLNADSMESGSKTIDLKQNHVFEFKDVYFKYPNSTSYVLNGINMRLPLNQRTALVGLNGSGKTTIVKLLCRFYQPTQGEILLDGIPIESYDLKTYYQLLSCVFQDFHLLSLSIQENIGDDEIKLNQSLQEAGVLHRISQLPQGIHTALYKDTPYLILDEPTAALDPYSEAEIFERFEKITQTRGALFISHNLSSCTFSDYIYVLEGGQLVESGTHQELLTLNQRYRKMWDMQIKKYN